MLDITRASTHKQPSRSILRRRQSLSSDIEAILGELIVAILIYVSSIHYEGTFRLLDMLSLLSLIAAMAFTYDSLGVYRRHGGLPSKIINLARAWALSFAIAVTFAFTMDVLDHFSRFHIGTIFFGGFIAQLLLHISLEFLQRGRLHLKTKEDAALIIGNGWLAGYICDRINANPWVPEKVIGGVTMPSENDGSAAVNYANQPPTLGAIDNIDFILDAHDIKTVYVITTLNGSDIVQQLYLKLLDRSINIHWVPDVFSLSLINLNVKELGGIPVITLSESPLSGRSLTIKNILDKIIASIGLLLVAPILIFVSIAIKIETRGPVLFFQKRTGWDGKVFSIWKFRTMVANTPKDGIIKQATINDPRVTCVGRFLRCTSIDELPQLFNVLVGNMSLVGPRPHAVQHNDEYSQKIVAYLARHRIKPGITGLAQVRGLRGETRELRLMEERVRSDIEYINNWSLMLDFSILFRTVLLILRSRGH